MTEFRVACIQNTATRDIQTNVEQVCAGIDEAVAGGAEFIALPETVGLIEPVNAQIPDATFSEAEDIGLGAFRERARRHGVTVLVGSQLILEDERIFNRSFLLDRNGEVRARYDKLHMFDNELKYGEAYRESDAIAPGGRAVIVETEWGKLGLSICYDLRFGALTVLWRWAGPNSLPFRPRLRKPPARHTGTSWCGRVQSRPVHLSSRRTSAGTIATSATLTDIR